MQLLGIAVHSGTEPTDLDSANRSQRILTVPKTGIGAFWGRTGFTYGFSTKAHWQRSERYPLLPFKAPQVSPGMLLREKKLGLCLVRITGALGRIFSSLDCGVSAATLWPHSVRAKFSRRPALALALFLIDGEVLLPPKLKRWWKEILFPNRSLQHSDSSLKLQLTPPLLSEMPTHSLSVPSLCSLSPVFPKLLLRRTELPPVKPWAAGLM